MVIKKRETLILAFLAFGILLIGIASATYCCEKTIPNPTTGAGGWCQQVNDINDCDSGFGRSETTCDSTTYCRIGTCVDNNVGECTQTGESICKSQAERVWFDPAIIEQDDIAACKEGCCIAGDTVSFGTEAHCNQVAAFYTGSNPVFREDLDAIECSSLDLVEQKGACVIEVNFRKECSIETKQDCANVNGAIFYNGLLCTAPGATPGSSISDAVKPNQPGTACGEDGKVYFTDSKGNLANIFDVAKDGIGNDDPDKVRNYWTYIQDPECEVELDASGRPTTSSCGACPYRLATACSKYSSTPDNLKPVQGPQDPYPDNSYVCKAMSCEYDNNNDGIMEIYSPGESWCYESKGTYPHIPNIIDKTVREKNNREIESLDYNLPGSVYYKLKCVYGEVVNDSCNIGTEGSRNKICSESYTETNGVAGIQVNAADDPETEINEANNDYSTAVCRANEWRACSDLTDSISCEDPKLHCKWLHGYRFDGTLISGFLGDPTELPDYGWELQDTNGDGVVVSGEDDYVSFGTADEQGSCVPLFSPGFDFWNPDSADGAECVSGYVAQGAVYETPLIQDRDRFAEWPITLASHMCLENCYLIPGYGTGIVSDTTTMLDKNGNLVPLTDEQVVEDIYENSVSGYSLKTRWDYNISTRQGQYCEPLNLGEEIGGAKDKESELEGRAIGEISVFPPVCASNENRVIKPLFYTNTQWLDFVTTRARSLGDCGYKLSSEGTPGQASSEIITVLFQKLNQKQEVIDEENSATAQQIWNPVTGFELGDWRGPPVQPENTTN